ncbi:hypothetical protein [Nonomuraea sp. NPDC049709]|uniref:hypothetical protein n=1 Tax=Nonomuraea sp. NPDC049709 TaxID=3154736 RepID=UPI00344A34E8
MKISDRLGHLTYSTLVHPGDTWSEMRESVAAHVPAVKRRVSPGAPMGVSLRLSGASVTALRADPAERAGFLGFLRQEGLYVYTVNAFPHGSFKGRSHFHVPVFLDEIGGFRTTRSNIEAALDLHRRTPLSDHLEIETYTWDVLPEHLKTGDVDDYVSREIEWVRDALGD